jgi:hypothetical protein
LGIPEVESLWNDLRDRDKQGELRKSEVIFLKKFSKALRLLSTNIVSRSFGLFMRSPLWWCRAYLVLSSSGLPPFGATGSKAMLPVEVYCY